MASLAKFYGGAVTPESFEGLNAGQIFALVHYKKEYEKARKQAAKRKGK